MICDKCIHKEVCKLYDPKSKLVGCIFFYSFPEKNDEVKLKVIDMREAENEHSKNGTIGKEESK